MKYTKSLQFDLLEAEKIGSKDCKILVLTESKFSKIFKNFPTFASSSFQREAMAKKSWKKLI